MSYTEVISQFPSVRAILAYLTVADVEWGGKRVSVVHESTPTEYTVKVRTNSTKRYFTISVPLHGNGELILTHYGTDGKVQSKDKYDYENIGDMIDQMEVMKLPGGAMRSRYKEAFSLIGTYRLLPSRTHETRDNRRDVHHLCPWFGYVEDNLIYTIDLHREALFTTHNLRIKCYRKPNQHGFEGVYHLDNLSSGAEKFILLSEEGYQETEWVSYVYKPTVVEDDDFKEVNENAPIKESETMKVSVEEGEIPTKTAESYIYPNSPLLTIDDIADVILANCNRHVNSFCIDGTLDSGERLIGVTFGQTGWLNILVGIKDGDVYLNQLATTHSRHYTTNLQAESTKTLAILSARSVNIPVINHLIDQMIAEAIASANRPLGSFFGGEPVNPSGKIDYGLNRSSFTYKEVELAMEEIAAIRSSSYFQWGFLYYLVIRFTSKEFDGKAILAKFGKSKSHKLTVEEAVYILNGIDWRLTFDGSQSGKSFDSNDGKAGLGGSGLAMHIP